MQARHLRRHLRAGARSRSHRTAPGWRERRLGRRRHVVSSQPLGSGVSVGGADTVFPRVARGQTSDWTYVKPVVHEACGYDGLADHYESAGWLSYSCEGCGEVVVLFDDGDVEQDEPAEPLLEDDELEPPESFPRGVEWPSPWRGLGDGR